MVGSSRHRVGVWADVAQSAFVRTVLERAACEAVGAGSPVKGQSGAVAAELSCPPADDLRAMLAVLECDAVCVFAPGDFGAGEEQADARAVAAARDRGVRVVCAEPVPASALALEGSGWTSSEGGVAPGQWMRFMALPRLSRPLRQAHETLLGFGPARAAQIECWSSRTHGTLGGRLFGAMDLVCALLGEPESVDAAHVGSPARTAGEPTLRDLHGDVMATLRFPDGRAATLAASDAAGRWGVGVTLISENGRLRFYDDGFEWVAPDGGKRDEWRAGHSRGAVDPQARAVTAFAESLERLLDRGLPDEGPVNLPAVLAASQAAVLSARTRQPESPMTIRRVIG